VTGTAGESSAMVLNDNRRIIAVADAAALAKTAAERLIARISRNNERVAICLNGGSSPKQLYELLGKEPYRSRIPWDRVHWFIGDERFVPANDPLNNMAMARRAFLDRCAPLVNIHPVATNVPTTDEAASRYEADLKDFYGAGRLERGRPMFDAVLMGVGPDGHTASLFPGDSALAEMERWVVGVSRAHVAPLVPRVTLTLPALGSCHEMLFEVSGADKHAILSRVLGGEDLPAARAQSSGETIWLVDRAALPENLRER
jgi:6-phosphogluconolactonase